MQHSSLIGGDQNRKNCFCCRTLTSTKHLFLLTALGKNFSAMKNVLKGLSFTSMLEGMGDSLVKIVPFLLCPT